MKKTIVLAAVIALLAGAASAQQAIPLTIASGESLSPVVDLSPQYVTTSAGTAMLMTRSLAAIITPSALEATSAAIVPWICTSAAGATCQKLHSTTDGSLITWTIPRPQGRGMGEQSGQVPGQRDRLQVVVPRLRARRLGHLEARSGVRADRLPLRLPEHSPLGQAWRSGVDRWRRLVAGRRDPSRTRNRLARHNVRARLACPVADAAIRVERV